jgi:plastocyanin
MANPSQIPHGIGVDGNGVDVDGPVVGPGKTSTATAELKPGTYEYYCTVKSHHQAGMEGTLVVK